jgi:MFS superfamily sulfate permease-like transporter
MDTGTWMLVIGGAIGLALAVFGVKMLVTGRAPVSIGRSFRDVHDAGLYHLLFGLGLLLLVVGTKLPGDLARIVSAVVAVALAVVAVVRYRPRGKGETEI